MLIQWIKERHDLDVVAFCADLGQPGDLDFIREKALRVGAVDSVAIDAREEFLSDFVLPLLNANALYEGKYPLATALARPLIARMLVDEARKRGAKAIAHGCTGKGNDQVRFDLTVMALAPDLKIIAPLRGDMNMSREEEIEYAQARGIPVPTTVESPYSVDENLWGRSCEAGVLEDPWNEPPEDAYTWTVSPAASPDAPAYLEIGFEAGKPASLDGRALSFLEIVEELNRKGRGVRGGPHRYDREPAGGDQVAGDLRSAGGHHPHRGASCPGDAHPYPGGPPLQAHTRGQVRRDDLFRPVVRAAAGSAAGGHGQAAGRR